MKRTDYTPLNIIERMNSKISLISSIAALVLFVLIFSFIDYEMVQKPVLDQQKQEEESAETKRRLTEDNVVSSVSVVASTVRKISPRCIWAHTSSRRA